MCLVVDQLHNCNATNIYTVIYTIQMMFKEQPLDFICNIMLIFIHAFILCQQQKGGMD